MGAGLFTYGWNVAGQVGDGTTTSQIVPVPISFGGLEVKAVELGFMHSGAVTVGVPHVRRGARGRREEEGRKKARVARDEGWRGMTE